MILARRLASSGKDLGENRHRRNVGLTCRGSAPSGAGGGLPIPCGRRPPPALFFFDTVGHRRQGNVVAQAREGKFGLADMGDPGSG